MKNSLAIIALGMLIMPNIQAQNARWQQGILVNEFIYEKASFPSCHASTIAETTGGGLVAAWFGGTHERHPDVSIYVSRQVDGQWTEPAMVADGVQTDGSRLPTWNPVLYQVPEGELQLYYKIGPKPSDWQGWMKTSKDGGKSWSEAVMLPKGYVGPVKNKPVLLENGNLLAGSSTEDDGWRVHFEISDDLGKTWEFIDPINDGKTLSAIQPTIFTHNDGKLQALCRSRNRAIVETWSEDFGKTWTPLVKSSLPNNNSGLDGVTLKDGRHVLIYNHVLPPGNEAGGPRSPLNLSISEDGKTWYAALIIEDFPGNEFSYPSIIQDSEGIIHAVYTWKRERVKYVKIDPSKLTLTEIKNAQWPY